MLPYSEGKTCTEELCMGLYGSGSLGIDFVFTNNYTAGRLELSLIQNSVNWQRNSLEIFGLK